MNNIKNINDDIDNNYREKKKNDNRNNKNIKSSYNNNYTDEGVVLVAVVVLPVVVLQKGIENVILKSIPSIRLREISNVVFKLYRIVMVAK